MSLRHVENIARLTASRLVPGPRCVAVEIEYTTAGGVDKVLKFSHSEAEQIRSLIGDQLDQMPAGPRKASFFASLRRKR
jgi:hypothetical protein